MLEASLEGIGKHHVTSIFPISIFCYKKGVNTDPGDPNYDLKQLALKSMAKRIYPEQSGLVRVTVQSTLCEPTHVGCAHYAC